MKVKIINEIDPFSLEDKINNFIKDKDVINIKYQICSSQRLFISALIMYKEN